MSTFKPIYNVKQCRKMLDAGLLWWAAFDVPARDDQPYDNYYEMANEEWKQLSWRESFANRVESGGFGIMVED